MIQRVPARPRGQVRRPLHRRGRRARRRGQEPRRGQPRRVLRAARQERRARRRRPCWRRTCTRTSVCPPRASSRTSTRAGSRPSRRALVPTSRPGPVAAAGRARRREPRPGAARGAQDALARGLAGAAGRVPRHRRRPRARRLRRRPDARGGHPHRRDRARAARDRERSTASCAPRSVVVSAAPSHADRLRSAIVERAMVELGTLPSPVDLVRKLARIDRPLAEMAWVEAQAMRMQLVVNQTRVRTDAELGAWMSGLVLAALRRRPRRARTHRAGRHGVARRCGATSRCSSTAPPARARATSSASRVACWRWPRPNRPSASRRSPMPTEEPTLYAVLGVTRSASDEEVRRGYKRQREIYATRRPRHGVDARRGPARRRAAQARRGLRHAPRRRAPPRVRPLDLPRGRAARPFGARRRAPPSLPSS